MRRENAIRLDMALGGSTNTTLHIPAIAHAAEVDITIADFDRLSREPPQLCSLRPGGEQMMEDLEFAGGVPSVLKNLATLLKKECLTVAGRTLEDVFQSAPTGDTNVIRPLDNPISREGGIAVLEGTLALDGAVVKQGAVAPSMLQFTGTARVFDADLPVRKIDLLVDESEMKKRQADWKRPKCKFRRGWLARYERLVTSAAQGAVLEPPEY